MKISYMLCKANIPWNDYYLDDSAESGENPDPERVLLAALQGVPYMSKADCSN